VARYRILSWRDIPTQVRVTDEAGARVDCRMPRWFMHEVSRVTMREGLAGSDDYLAGFEWSAEAERPGSAEEVAAAVVAELAATWGRDPDGRPLRSRRASRPDGASIQGPDEPG